jgi:dethiobiotin synthetase
VAAVDPGNAGAPRGLFVTGTDTEVGKTVVAAALIAAARRSGVRVAAFKPVVTGIEDGPASEQDDAILARAAGSSAQVVAPHRFGPPMSPHLAADLAGTPLDLDRLAAAARVAARGHDLLVVEGVGGLLVPLNDTASIRDLAQALRLPLVVAARPGLGTINHTLLTLEAARAAELHVAAVVLTPWPDAPDPIAG